MTQTEQIRSGGSYLSQSDLRVHFGLGTAMKTDSVEIRWPSGTVEVIKNLEADKLYAVLEGKGIVPTEQTRWQLLLINASERVRGYISLVQHFSNSNSIGLIQKS